MGKRKEDYSKATFDHKGNFDLEATIEDRDFENEQRAAAKIAYVAPEGKQKWRARDLVDIHWMLTGIETPSASYNRIMSCIIGHANPVSGRCQLKQKLIAVETGYSVATVKRAITWWVFQKFLRVEATGLARSNAYHPQWDLFELHYVAVANEINSEKQSWAGDAAMVSGRRHGGAMHPEVIKGTYAGVIKGTYGECHHVDPHEPQIGISKEESHPEWARPSSVADANVVSLNEKEGIQEGEAESASTNSNLSVGLSYEEACTLVSEYCGPFEWDNLTEDDFEAAVTAEKQKAGAGRSVINEAAMAAFRAKRKGGAK